MMTEKEWIDFSHRIIYHQNNHNTSLVKIILQEALNRGLVLVKKSKLEEARELYKTNSDFIMRSTDTKKIIELYEEAIKELEDKFNDINNK